MKMILGEFEMQSMFEYLESKNFNSMTINFNDHKGCYRTAKEEIESDEQDPPRSMFDDITPEERKIMCDTDTIWMIQIYPDTPIGFVTFTSYSLFNALKKACDYFINFGEKNE